MLSDDDILSLQADRHALERTEQFANAEEYCLFLMHERAYREAAAYAAGRTVLDLGCNNGYGSAILAESAARVVGADVSGRAIAAAGARARPRTLEFQQVDGKQLPFDAGSFDLVVSFQVIEHVSDERLFLREIARVLRDGGNAIFTTPNATLRLDPGMPPWNPFHVREYTPGQLRSVLAAHFGTVEVRGLFAADHFYQVEAGRVARARKRARRIVRAALTRKLKRAIRPEHLRLVRTLLPRARRRPPDLGAYSLEDLHYGCDSLEQALDLMAVVEPAPGDRRS